MAIMLNVWHNFFISAPGPAFFIWKLTMLPAFVPWIHNFLNNQKVFHQIVVVNQIDTHR